MILAGSKTFGGFHDGPIYLSDIDDFPGGQEKMLRIWGPNLSIKNKLGEKKLFNKFILGAMFRT